MSKTMLTLFMGSFALAAVLVPSVPSAAQTQEIKSKPPMYSYVANWQVPRANWGDIDKVAAPINDVSQKALADGTAIGYGSDITLVHTADGETHDFWWSSMSMAGVIKAMEQARAASGTNSAALNNAKHWDEVFVSHYYNWKPGSFKGAYTRVAAYKLKADAPDDALDNLAQHFIVPILEKALADGTIVEYEIDTPAVHTEAPGMFDIVYIASAPEGFDKVQAAVSAGAKEHPLAGQSFSSVTDDSAHRDEWLRSDGAYK